MNNYDGRFKYFINSLFIYTWYCIINSTLGIKCIRVLGKVDKIVDNVDEKVTSLDGLFGIVDKITDGIVLASDSIISGGSDFLSRIFNRKKKEDDIDV